MDDFPLQPTQDKEDSNVVYIEFLSKKNFPPGDWMKEPDYVQWEQKGLLCLALRDMKLGMWRGFVALPNTHKYHGKTLENILEEELFEHLDVHGGISVAGKLPAKYKELNRGNWWMGFECALGGDLLPLAKLDPNDPLQASVMEQQIYKDIHFVRREVNHLARQLAKVR